METIAFAAYTFLCDVYGDIHVRARALITIYGRVTRYAECFGGPFGVGLYFTRRVVGILLKLRPHFLQIKSSSKILIKLQPFDETAHFPISQDPAHMMKSLSNDSF